MSLKKKTAFLVIHGVGPHQPFEVCDSFVRSFYEELGNKNTSTEMHHRLKQRDNWIQNCISLSVPDSAGRIDFYEYFWDIFMVHEVHLSEAFQLLIRASKGAQRFYKEHPEFVDEALDLGSEYGRKRRLGRGREFAPDGYLKILGPVFIGFLKVLPYLPFLAKLLERWAITQVPILSHVFNGFKVLIERAAQDFIGDVVGYLDLDPRSEHYQTRQEIISGAVAELRALMADDYDEIIIAGHSLGSVIAYDTLNRIIQGTNAGTIKEEEASKIVGLVTFGSPLDKIAFFFRERVEGAKEVQRQILANLHGFRTRSLVEDEEGKPNIKIESPMHFGLPEIRWLNFYHPKDLISGRLDLYDLKSPPPLRVKGKKEDGNILVEAKIGRTAAHSCYWGEHLGKDKGTNQMYRDIIHEFFQ